MGILLKPAVIPAKGVLKGRMSMWGILAALASIGITAALILVLWRINAPLRRGGDSADAGVYAGAKRADSDAGSDGGE